MGLDTTHDAWHGPYSSFMAWRVKVAELAGFPPLELMEGYYSEGGYSNPFALLDYKYPKGDELDISALNRIRKRLPIKWDLFGNHPLVELLTHSDCDGHINYGSCKKIADELEKILPLIPEGMDRHKDNTERFIKGLRLAYKKKQRLEFH